jgi:phosphopantetheinyl transferase
MGIILAVKHVNIVETSDNKPLRRITKHYPKRDVSKLSKSKIAEHTAVINCLEELLESEDWWVEHKVSGAPILFIGGIQNNLKISISHAIGHVNGSNKIAHAAVIIRQGDSQDNDNIGVDLVIKGDPRLQRIAARVMSKEEVKGERLEEVWACKEAMYKAFGPGLDFVKDLKVDFISENMLKGLERKWEVRRQGNLVIVMGPC